MLECLARAAAPRQSLQQQQRLMSFSAELIAPSNTKSGTDFFNAVHRLTANPSLGFLTIGGSGPLVDNHHVQGLLSRWGNETQWQRVPLVLNLMCRHMDAAALAKTVHAARAHGAISGFCVLRGNPNVRRPTGEAADAFQYPSDLLRHLTSTETSFQLAAGGSPSDDRTAADQDWHYILEKLRAGAQAIFPTPTIQHDHNTLAKWLREAPQQLSERPGVPTATTYAVPCVLASVAPKLLDRIVSSRQWPVPADLDGPLRVGLLPPHPNSNIDEDIWTANTARVFKRIMTEYTAKHLRGILDAQHPEVEEVAAAAAQPVHKSRCVVPRHVHIVTYENSADDVLSLVQAVQQQQQQQTVRK